MKVVNDLAHQGLIETTRGRGGGLRLLKGPGAIRIGDVVRASETDFRLVECFDARTNLCSLTPSCRLKHVFDDALQAYFKALDSATLTDVNLGTAAARGAAAGPAGHGSLRAMAMPCRSPARAGEGHPVALRPAAGSLISVHPPPRPPARVLPAPHEDHHVTTPRSPDPDSIYPFDARGVAKRFRHAAIFGALDSLQPGETMRFANDHDPLPLLAQLAQRYGDGVGVDTGTASRA